MAQTASIPVNLLVRSLKEQVYARSKNIVIIGDVMVDRWVRGQMEPSQDGCDKFVQYSMVEVPGGAANAERSLASWGVRTSLYGYSSTDCPVKTRYLCNGRIVFRADNDRANDRHYDWAYSLAEEMVGSAGAVLLSDYDKGFLQPAFMRRVIDVCRERGIPCVVDCKRHPELYRGAILKCNYEYSMHPDTCYMAEVITRGQEVPFVMGNPVPYSATPVECLNHVGAGDCFAAHLTLALAHGFTLVQAAILAHSAGRVYVQYPDNKPPELNKIDYDLSTWR